MTDETDRAILRPPGGETRVLLHSCCAPCSGEVMEAMLASGVDYTIFFYNPNIHPEREYLLRKDENVRFAEKHGVAFIDADYDTDNWFARAKGLEWEPERGARCTMCFDMRFERTALYAHEHTFSGSVSYAVEVYDSASDRLLLAYVAKQYPWAEDVAASFGPMDASKAGIRSGAAALREQLH